MDDSTPGVGDTIVYTITATNNGINNTANVGGHRPSAHRRDLRIQHPLSGNLQQRNGAWSVGSLNVGATATLTLTATVDAGTGGDTITNTATFTGSDYSDPVSANDTDSVDITVTAAPDLLVMKTATTVPIPQAGPIPRPYPGP